MFMTTKYSAVILCIFFNRNNENHIYFSRYGKVVETPNWKLSLFDFLYKEIESYNVDTESEDEAEDGEKSQPESSKPAKRKLITGKWTITM